jgi:hypothetical protein
VPYVVTLVLIEHLYLSGIWQGYCVEEHSQNDPCYDEFGPYAQNVIIILGSRPLQSLQEKENLQFDLL